MDVTLLSLRGVLKVLEDVGFAPELTPDGTAIQLRRCPFKELVQQDREHALDACHDHLEVLQHMLGRASHSGVIPLIPPDGTDYARVARLTPVTAGIR